MLSKRDVDAGAGTADGHWSVMVAPCAGLCLMFAWISHMNGLPAVAQDPSLVFAFYLARAVALVVCAACAACLRQAHGIRPAASSMGAARVSDAAGFHPPNIPPATVAHHARSRRAPVVADAAAAVLMAVGAAIAWASSGLPDPGLFALVGVLAGGAALGWLYLRWAVLLVGRRLSDVVACLFVSVAAWRVLVACLRLVPEGLTACTLGVLLPAASCALLIHSLGQPAATRAAEHKPFEPRDLVSLWRVWIPVIVTSLALSLVMAMSPLASIRTALAPNVLTVALCACILAWALGSKLAFDFASLWRVVLFLLAASLGLAAMGVGTAIAWALLMATWQLIMPVTWLTVCDVAAHAHANPYVVAGGGLAAFCLPMALGDALSSVLPADLPTRTVLVGVLLALFVVLGTCLDTRDPNTQRIFESLRANQPQVAEFVRIEERCREIGAERSLSEREVQVMAMVCEGRTRAYIAETLYITDNTVKTHVSRLYAKLGVHSKAELQELVGV